MIHPEGMLQRRSAEHWAGRLYMRRISLRITRVLSTVTVITPNGLTYLMMLTGVLVSVALVVPGLTGAVLGALLIQVYLLLDCVDGEVARWQPADLADRRLPGPGRPLRVRGRAADRPGPAGRRPVPPGGHARRLAVGLPGHAGRARRDPDQVRDRPGRRRPGPLRPDRRRGQRLGAALDRGGQGPPGRLAAEVPPAGRRGGGVAVHPGRHRRRGRGDLFFTRLAVVVLAAIAVLQTVLHLLSIVLSSRLR